MKLLSPAGNFEALKSAICVGADEVYLGVNEFNARNNIDGFDMENLEKAIEYSHLFGVKVLLAVNILFSDDEIISALELVVKAYALGVDAVIVQDLGLAKLISENYPEIELHASTQMGIHNLEGVKEIESLGFKRVVLARETPLNEIKRIRENSAIEIEYFVHGALCVSFSGNCYLSSYLNGASGNRGRCKQLCRLPYSLRLKGKTIKDGYLLSAKDFDLSKRLSDLKNAGVDVLKIEGRARRPFYVYTATNEYKKALGGKPMDRQAIELAFNRGFTEGYFNGNGNVVSEFQNHIGVEIGNVIRVNNGKKFNEIFFTCNRELVPESVLKFYKNNRELVTITAFDLKEIKSGEYRVTTTQKIENGCVVRLIADSQKEKEVLNFSMRRKLSITLSVQVNQPLSASVTIGDNDVAIEGAVAREAKNQPLTKQLLIENFSKSEYFDAELVFDKFEPVFVAKSELNAFRRRVFESAYNLIVKPTRSPLKSIVELKCYKYQTFSDFEYVDNVNAILSKANVIYSPETYSVDDVETLQKRCNAQGRVLYLDLPNFALKEDISYLKDIIEQTGVLTVANNYYALKLNASVIGAGLNVFNSVSASVFNLPIISAEDNVGSKFAFPYMTLRFCPIKNHIGGTCKNCKYADGYKLVMQSGKELKLKRKKLSTCTFYLID